MPTEEQLLQPIAVPQPYEPAIQISVDVSGITQRDHAIEESPFPDPDNYQAPKQPTILRMTRTTENALLSNRLVGSTVNSILKRPIAHALVRCTKDVLNVVLDFDAV